jgi:hypothetical protein
MALDYTTVETSDVSGTMTWTAARSGACHGMAVWFEALVAEGISYSNAPGQSETVYGQCFLPWPVPIDLAAGDRITVILNADLVGEEYVWRWESRVNDGQRLDRVKAAFEQSSFLGIPLAPALLRKRSAQFVPTLNENGEIERFIMNLMDGRASVQEIAQQVCNRYKGRALGAKVWEGIAQREDISWAGLKNVTFTCRVRECLRDRVAYVFRRVFTPTESEWTWHALPKPLHFLYFPIWALRLTAEHGGLMVKRAGLGSKK